MKPFSLNFMLALGLVAASDHVFAPAFANDRATPPPPDDKETTPFVVTPESLRVRALDKSIDILLAANRVHRAKNEVSLARASLLPSLNLGALLMSAASPTFILASVDVLLPFLLPSKWFEAAQAKEQLEADKKAYHVVQMNTYASVYSLYAELLSDAALIEVLSRDLEDWRSIESINDQRHRWGLVSDDDLAQSKGERGLAQLRLSKVSGLVIEEKASIRYALGLNYQRDVVLTPNQTPPSEFEGRPFDTTLDAAYLASPELAQINHLIEAAKLEKWARAFGFASGFSVSQQSSSGNVKLAFDDLTGRGSIDLGFSRIPLVNLSERNIEELQLRGFELKREMGRVLSVTLDKIPLLIERLQIATETEDRLRQNFSSNLARYQRGEGIPFEDVLRSRLSIQEATLERVRAQTDLSLVRLNMHRMLRTDEFVKIEGCKDPNLSYNGSDKGRTRPICR